MPPIHPSHRHCRHFAYFVHNLNDANYRIADSWRAVLGICSAAALYTLFGVLLTLCPGGSLGFGSLAIILDIAFVGGFIFVAYATRGWSRGCSGGVYTPLGDGYAGTFTGLRIASSLRRACQLNTVCFAFAITLCVLFLLSAIFQAFMVRKRDTRRYRGGKG